MLMALSKWVRALQVPAYSSPLRVVGWAGERHGPVGFPAAAAVGREGLLPHRYVAPGPAEADVDGPAVVLVRSVEQADAVVTEATVHGRLEHTPPAVHPIDRPSLGDRVVQADRKTP